tara:strand:- start:433 stop:657 length:225 start_codon:yes stop_codon:yes gene_type:complete
MIKDSSNSKNIKIKNYLEIPDKKNISSKIFRQELTTWEHTNSGIKKTTIVRSFDEEKHIDSYVSEPIIIKSFIK